MTRLTIRRLEAIVEALDFRLAGELGDEACAQADYEAARDWADDELCRRQLRADDRRAAHQGASEP